MFALDSSGSLGMNNFNKMKEFIVEVLQSINVGQDHSHIGIIKFDDSAMIESRLGVADSRKSVCEALARIKYTRGSTNTAAALSLASSAEMFNLREGGQPYRSRFTLLYPLQNPVKILKLGTITGSMSNIWYTAHKMNTFFLF